MNLPHLDTLDLPPSWCMLHPRTGQPTSVDRSACLEVRVSEVRRLAACVSVNPRTGRDRADAPRFQLPGRRPCPTRDGRRATGVFVLNAAMIDWLGSRRPKRQLRGDYRGTRANAMRPVGWSPEHGAPPVTLPPGEEIRHCRPVTHRNRHSFGHRAPNGTRTQRSTPTHRVLLDNILPGNPNRLGPFDPEAADAQTIVRGGGGVTTRKIHALPDDWTQPLRIEQWAIPTGPTSTRYYLVCPGCGRDARESIEPEFENDPRLPGLSRTPWGQNARQSERHRQCPHRVYYLYLPLCTPDEARDARVAQLFLASRPQRHHHAPDAQRLRRRYAPLFAPRTLLCRHCLNLRYGLHPESPRQHYHRTKQAQREYRP